MKKVAFGLLIALAMTSCYQEQKAETSRPDPKEIAQEALTAELDSIHKNGLIQGFAVAMVDQEGVLYTKGFGYANREAQEAYTEHTIQHIASVSKTLIGISLLKAKELGKLQFDDPIQQYLDFPVANPKFPDQEITIRHLATHTSGISDTEQYMEKAWILIEDQDLTNVSTEYPEQQFNQPDANVPMEEYLKGYLEVNGSFYQADNYSEFAPDERYNYSNIGATLCALVLEKATGQSYDSFTKEHILTPLNMTASGWSLSDVDRSKHSKLYRNDNSLLPFYTAITYPDGMLISSSSDMANYLHELVKGYCGEGTLLSKESYQEFFTPQLEAKHFESRNAENPYDEDYDPALFVGHSALGYVGHSGGDAGVATWFFINKEQKTGRYIVINCDMGNDERARELEYYAIWDKLNQYFGKL